MSDHKKHHEKVEHETEAVIETVEKESTPEEPIAQVAPQVKLRAAWDVLKAVFEKWQMHWRVLTSIQIVWAAAFLVVVIFSGISAGLKLAHAGIISDSMTSQEITAALSTHADVLAVIVVGAIIMAAILLVLSTWMSLATVQAWSWIMKEEHDQLSVRRAYATTWPLVPSYIWISVLAVLLLALGFFGLVIPGILLGISFTLLGAIAVIEKLKGKHAIMRATRLARPYLIPMLWRLIVAAVVLYLPARIVAGIFNMFTSGLGDALNQMYGLVASPIFIGVIFATYLELKSAEKKEHYEVWLSLERMALAGAVIMAFLFTLALVFGKHG